LPFLFSHSHSSQHALQQIPHTNPTHTTNSTVQAPAPEPTTPTPEPTTPPPSLAEQESQTTGGYLLNTSDGTCFDSDRGITSDVKGYVIDEQGIRHDDVCEQNNNVLREYYCSEYEKDYLGIKYIQCSLCQDGACVTPPPAVKLCVESNAKSLDFSTAGSVTDTRTKAVFNDTCSTPYVLFKYYCDFSDHVGKRATTCPNGCKAGACSP